VGLKEKKTSEQALITQCLKEDRKAQKALYERFGPRMKSVCLRYCYNRSLAEEVMNKGFFKVFKSLNTYSGKGSFEGWIRQIMVRTCLDENRKNTLLKVDEEVEVHVPDSLSASNQKHDADYLLRLIEALPYGYKMVFNLYEIEGYSHKEIAKQLEISESASRSQLTRAKKVLQEQLKELQNS
jgi:RNA polymerase sigma-70 factor (ECF subfamily)